MISVHLMGGLGNQLFMISTVIAYAIENKVKFVLSKYKADEFTGFKHPTYWNNFLKRLKPFLEDKPRNFPLFHEKQHNFVKIPNSLKNNNFMLYGYFQSHKYFERYKEQIFNIIGIKNTQQQINEKYNYYFENQGEIVSLHFRIGNYKKLQHCHNILHIDYYKNALINILEKNNNITNVLCFGQKEDVNILEKNIEILQITFPQLKFVLCNFEIEDWEQMVLMSCCNHNIIANSSFSWWGAYFNNNGEKLVCYPNKWFGPKLENKKTYDMFPKTWIKI